MSEINDQTDDEEKPMSAYIFKFTYTLALAFAIGAGYFYWEPLSGFFMDDEGNVKRAKGGPGNSQTTKKEKNVKYWRAPMDPTYISDKPGKSPMGMELIPVYEEEDEGSGIVKINPAVVQNIGVRSAKARRVEMSKTIRTVGLVTYDERKLAKIQSKVKGWVEKLYVNETGQKVEIGTILLELYSPDLVTTQEEFLLALKYRDSLKKSPYKSIEEGGESLLASTRRRLELFDVPAHQIKELEKTGKVRKTLHIHSAAEGVVIKKNIIEGMHIKPGDTLYEIADLRNVWVNVDIYEYEIPYVKVGQKADMTLASFPGRKFEGQITYIYPFMDAKSRTVKVRLEFDNTDMELKPDMYGDIVVRAGEGKMAIAVPTESVIRTGSRSMLFVALGKGRFEPRDVVIGFESEGMTEIISGVKDGESVVTSAQFLIDSESKLREAVSKMTAQPEADTAETENGSADHSEMKNMDTGHETEDRSKMEQSPQDHESMNHQGN